MRLTIDLGEAYTPVQAARVLGIGTATIYRWIKSGQVTSYRLAGRPYIPLTEIERLRRERAVANDYHLLDESGPKEGTRRGGAEASTDHGGAVAAAHCGLACELSPA